MAGCACGALVNLFQLEYGYPESDEQKRRGQEFGKLERQFSDNDEEITILEPEQDRLEQAEQFTHPFQQASSVVAGTSKDTPRTKSRKRSQLRGLSPSQWMCAEGRL